MSSIGREVHATPANPAAYSLIGRTRASIAYEIAYFMNGTGRIEILNLDQYSDMMRRRPLSQLIGIYTTMFFNRIRLAKKLKRDERFMF